ncbi:MAG: type II toxin-antitoxin system RelE/ParE family toxin [Candidatus Babeliales bacterium]
MSGNKVYYIKYAPEVLKKDIPSLAQTVKKVIERAIKEKLSTDPITFGKPLRYSLKGYRSLRVGNYRVVFTIQREQNRVIIVAIKHRKDAYN